MPIALVISDVVVASEDQVAADLSGEVIILGMREGAYFSVSDVAARIWELVQVPRRLSDVVATLMAEYDVTPEACSSEVLTFVAELVERGLVVRRAEPTA
ncbi:MAG: PqqD family peptide modification chaperone [Gemmatimonadaceae bacterium]